MPPDGKIPNSAAARASAAVKRAEPKSDESAGAPGQPRGSPLGDDRLRTEQRLRHVLVLGATYGSLFATKLLLAGHSVRLVGLPSAAGLIQQQGTRVRMPVKGRAELLEVDSRRLPGKLTASTPAAVGPLSYDLVVLAMQEPQYRSPQVRALLDDVAKARIPCLSIMNMPPLPFLRRIPGISVDDCRPCYTDATVWDAFDPALVAHCSADPQASHVPDGPENLIQVRLPTNFKACRFVSETHTALLRSLAADIGAARLHTDDGPLELPVKFKVHDSVFVPLAKWPMLIAGNYRCIASDGIRSIEAAVHSDLNATRRVYDWVTDLCRALGADEQVLVPFDKYAEAAFALKAPSSVARALSAAAPYIERVDRLVQKLAMQKGGRLALLDDIVALVDARLTANRHGAA